MHARRRSSQKRKREKKWIEVDTGEREEKGENKRELSLYSCYSRL